MVETTPAGAVAVDKTARAVTEKKFKDFIKTSDVMALPEKGVMLTSNLVWGEKRIFFTPENTYITKIPGGATLTCSTRYGV